MSMTDPIADLFTRIRNAQAARKPDVSCAASKLKVSIATLLRDEGYIAGFTTETDGAKSTLTVHLKYHEGRPVIERLERVSRPGLRAYRGKDELLSKKIVPSNVYEGIKDKVIARQKS